MKKMKGIVLTSVLAIFLLQSTVGFAFNMLTGFSFNFGVQINKHQSGSCVTADMWLSKDHYLANPDNPFFSGPIALHGQSIPKGWFVKIYFDVDGIPLEKVIYTRLVVKKGESISYVENNLAKGYTLEELEDMEDELRVPISSGGVFEFDSNSIEGTGSVRLGFEVLHKNGETVRYFWIFAVTSDREETGISYCTLNVVANPDCDIYPIGFQCVNSEHKAQISKNTLGVGVANDEFGMLEGNQPTDLDESGVVQEEQIIDGQVDDVNQENELVLEGSYSELVSEFFALTYPDNMSNVSIAGKTAKETGFLYLLCDNPVNIRVFYGSDSLYNDIFVDEWNYEPETGKYFIGLTDVNSSQITIVPLDESMPMAIVPLTSNIVVTEYETTYWYGLEGNESGIALIQ